MTEVQWRDYEDNDYEAVVLLHEKMQRRVGRDLDLPHPGQRPVLICQVGETNGVITHAIFGEAQMEICAMGETPLVPEQLAPVVRRFHQVAQFYHIRLARAFVPKQLLDTPDGKAMPIRRILESDTVNFTEDKGTKGVLVPFFYWIPPQPEDTEGKAA